MHRSRSSFEVLGTVNPVLELMMSALYMMPVMAPAQLIILTLPSASVMVVRSCGSYFSATDLSSPSIFCERTSVMSSAVSM